MSYRSLISPPPADERTHIIIYHDGVTVVSEKRGKHGTWVKLSEYHYTGEQFVKALSVGSGNPAHSSASDNHGGIEGTVPSQEPNSSTVSSSEASEPQGPKSWVRPAVFGRRSEPAGDTGSGSTSNDPSADDARG